MLPNIFWSRTDYISGAYATKMVAISSPGTSTCCPRITGRKNWQAWHTASISKQLMCRFDSSSDHRPKVGLPSHSAPQPLLEASVVTTFLLCAVSRVTPRFSQRGFLQWVRADTQARVTVMRWRRANDITRMSSSSAFSLALREADDGKRAGSATEPDNSSASEATRERLSSSSLSLTPNEITSLAAAEGHWSSWVKRTGECSLCDSKVRGHWADASSLVTGYSNTLPRNFFHHRSLGGRKREGTRGGVAFWEESYPWAQRSKTETLTVRAISPVERGITVGFPQAWYTLSMSVMRVQGWLYSQTPLPFWRAMAGWIAIGSLATTVDWFIFLS